jgi:hypothetical protein
MWAFRELSHHPIAPHPRVDLGLVGRKECHRKPIKGNHNSKIDERKRGGFVRFGRNG